MTHVILLFKTKYTFCASSVNLFYNEICLPDHGNQTMCAWNPINFQTYIHNMPLKINSVQIFMKNYWIFFFFFLPQLNTHIKQVISCLPKLNICFQKWNQLSRFQKNILYFAVISIVIIIIYVLPGKTQIPIPIDEIDYDSAKVVHNNRQVNRVICNFILS